MPDELRAIGSETRHDRRAQSFSAHLRNRLTRIRIYEIEPTDILCFGNTRNNRREFDFLFSLLSEHEVDVRNAQFPDKPKSASTSFFKRSKPLIERVLEETQTYVGQNDLSPAHLWQLLQYVLTFINIRASYSETSAIPPGLAVVANDHSPAQVAFKAVMEELSVPVAYVQHAEVSPAFPPLDYAISILRNQVSLDIYTQVGPLKGDVFILSRNPEGSRFQQVVRVSAEAGDRRLVGVYPTSRFDRETVFEALKKLQRNPAVADYFLKLHPDSATKLSDSERSEYRVRTDIPSESHVAVVGNSSVATELLASGIPVYQLFELDEIERDYYGFVATCLTKEIVAEQLANNAFWNDGFYNSAWLSRAAKFDPSITVDQRQARSEVAHYLKRMLPRQPTGQKFRSAAPVTSRKLLRHIGWCLSTLMERAVRTLLEAVPQKSRLEAVPQKSRTSIPVRSAEAIAALMDQSSNRLQLADVLLSTATDGSIQSDVINWFQALWTKRDERAFELVRAVAAAATPPRDAWLRSIAYDVMALPLSKHMSLQLVDDIANITHPHARRLYEATIMRVLLRNGHLDEFQELLRRSPVHTIDRLSSNVKVELARHLFAEIGAHKAQARDDLLRDLTEYERTKVFAAGVASSNEDVSQSALEEKFVQLSTPRLASEFREMVLPAYASMRGQMRFIDVRTNKDQQLDLRRRILDAVESRQPFSLIRLGDGEAYLFGGKVGPFTLADCEMRERHWWNTLLPAELSDRIKAKSLQAVCAADVLGIPSMHRFFRDYSQKSPRLLTSTATRGIVTSILGAASTIGETVELTEERAHHILFQPDWLRELLRKARRIIVVSSIREHVVVDHLGGYANYIEVVSIPTHAKTKQNPYFVEWDEPLPLVLDSIEAELRNLICPGDLVLVSAGVAGKSFIGISKEMGAVCLDLGGQIEPLVGVPNGALY